MAGGSTKAGCTKLGKGKKRVENRAFVPVPDQVPLDQREPVVLRNYELFSVEITPTDLSNRFFARVSVPAYPLSAAASKGYSVMGQHTVENLAFMIASELWKENLVFTPGVEIRLFEDGIERAPTTLLAQLLKDNIRAFRGDGCTLEFECVTSGGIWGADVQLFEEDA